METFFQQVTIPVSPLSKLVQIFKIIQTGKSHLLSKVPWAIFAASSLGTFLQILTNFVKL